MNQYEETENAKSGILESLIYFLYAESVCTPPSTRTETYYDLVAWRFRARSHYRDDVVFHGKINAIFNNIMHHVVNIQTEYQ